jgi:predicted DNA repair protein MutK
MCQETLINQLVTTTPAIFLLDSFFCITRFPQLNITCTFLHFSFAASLFCEWQAREKEGNEAHSLDSSIVVSLDCNAPILPRLKKSVHVDIKLNRKKKIGFFSVGIQ